MILHTTSAVREWGCKRRYRYKYIDLVRPAIKGKALMVGDAVHRGLESYKLGSTLAATIADLNMYCQGDYWDTPDGPQELARVRAMLRAYYHRWADTRDDWEVLENETNFDVELADGIRFGGRRDFLGRHVANGGALYLWDHKTTSEEVSNVGEDFWGRLALDTQITGYCEAVARQYGEMPRVIWDVIRKPSSKMGNRRDAKGKAVRIVRRKSESDDEYAQRRMAALESVEEFEDRLYNEMVSDPDRYLVRREVHRTPSQHAELLADLIERCREIQDYDGTYPRNDALCQSRYGTCPYLGVCAGVEQLDSERFERLETPHPELKAEIWQEPIPGLGA